ncbi:MAG: hypothetical protein P3T54_00045 [Dehalogenimonas sp.]|nr:hypothetical protein [Dehalogenimonas sp.]
MSAIGEFRVVGERFGQGNADALLFGLIKKVEPPLVRTVQKGEMYEADTKDTR